MGIDDIDPGFGYWLAGFIDGEGSFNIMPNRKHYICRMTLRLRDDDTAVLREIRARTGIGNINHLPPPRPECGGEVTWSVQSNRDCLSLIELLDVYPLRAKKARDYAIWREAVRLAATARRGHGAALRNDALWATLAGLRAKLRDGRTYEHLGDRLEERVVDPIADDPQLVLKEWIDPGDVPPVPLAEN